MISNNKQNLLIFVTIYVILSILLFDPKLFVGGDNARYLTLAEAIGTGKGYREIYLPDEPRFTLYPPGFSLILTPIYLLFGYNILMFKFLMLLFGIGAFIFSFLLLKEIFKDKYLMPLLIFLLTPIFIIYNHWILSEIPFLFFSLGALYFFIKAQTSKKHYYYLSFIFSTCSFFIRTAGISVIIGLMFFLLLKKEFKYSIVFLIIFLAVFVPWQIRNASIPGEGGYIGPLLAKDPYQMESVRIGFPDLVKRVWDNFNLYSFNLLPVTLIPILKSGGLLTLVGFVFIAFTIIGFIKSLKSLFILGAYFIPSVLVLVGWPQVWSSDRFLLPLLPIFIIYIFFAIFWLAEKLKSKYLAPVITGIFILLNFWSIVPMAKEATTNNIRYLQGNKYAGYSADWQRHFELIEWINANIPKDRVIMARKPMFVYLLSKHKSFTYPFSTDHNKIKDAITQSDYILYDNFFWTGTTQRYLLPVIQEAPENYEIVHQTKKPEFFLLKVKK